MIFNCLYLMAVFIKTFLFITMNIFVVNWFQWHKNYSTFLEAPSMINESTRNALFHWIASTGSSFYPSQALKHKHFGYFFLLSEMIFHQKRL
jgi:hypothetical protein